ncbi:hypothetical protein [Lysobacter sp. CA196]|uniref:hypothetical protein n=1 Tax=Lysobacter sp. CA196 TaxID=3455606 RepID=UPI003F8D3F01
MNRNVISLKRDSSRLLSAVPLGELGVAALDDLTGTVEVKAEYETIFSVEISFVWISHGMPIISDEHLHHFGLEVNC